MKGPFKKNIGRLEFNFAFFENVAALDSFVECQSLLLSDWNKYQHHRVVESTKHLVEQGTSWYGTPKPTTFEEMETHKSFLGMDLLKEVRPLLKGRLDKFLSQVDQELLPQPTIQYNDKAKGIFVFDRAAMGMYRLGQVRLDSRNDVLESQLNIALKRDRIKTKVKTVYAAKEYPYSSRPSLRLYVLAGANADVRGNEMLYLGFSCNELVEFLEARLISVEVNVILATQFSSEGKTRLNAGIITVKKFEESLNTNQLLLLCSDPRFFRFKGFKGLICLSDLFDTSIPDGLGSIESGMHTKIVNHLNKFDPSHKGYVFGQSYSLDGAVKEVEKVIRQFIEENENFSRST